MEAVVRKAHHVDCALSHMRVPRQVGYLEESVEWMVGNTLSLV